MKAKNPVAVIGLGAMGAAIADALHATGHDVVVWNRSPGRMQPYRDRGIACAADVGDVLERCTVVMICIADYTATRELFGPAASQQLAGRTLIQLSTGTPEEARTLEHWTTAAGGTYLDGAILAYPDEIGDAALIAVAGNEAVWNECQPLLDALSSDVRYLGEAIGAAAALDVAVLSYYVCAHLGLVHGALICESEQVPPELLTGVIADSLPSDTEELQKLGAALNRDDFSEPGASLGVYSGVIDRILAQAEDAGINAEIPTFADRIYKRGVKQGLADEEVVALVKMLRRDRHRN